MKLIIRLGILCAVLTLSAANVFGRSAIPEDHMSFPVLIKLQGGPSASGFFYSNTTNLFLVTSKHVLFHPNTTNLVAKSVTLLSYEKGITKNPKRIEMVVNIEALLRDGMVRWHSKHDVAVVWLAKCIKGKDDADEVVYPGKYVQHPNDLRGTILVMFDSNLKKYEDVLVSNEVYLFGYPDSIGIKQIPQIDYDLPLLRRGIIAGKNSKQSTLILDCPVYYGNSGGPVCEVEETSMGNVIFKIVGLVSQFIPFAELWENKTHRYVNIEISNSGYSVVTPVDYMLEIVW